MSKMPSHWSFGHLQPKLWAKEGLGVKLALKVGNRPLPDIRIGSATWRWKALEESYNFGSDLVLIRLDSQKI